MNDGLISRIDQKLSELGITPRELSKTSGLGQDFVSELLRGRKQNVRSDNLDRIARGLGTTSQWLLTGSDEVSRDMPWKQPPATSIPEIDVRAGAGGGGVVGSHRTIDDWGNSIEADNVSATWSIPPAYLRGELRVDPRRIYIVEVMGDSMSPTLTSGDRVMVDTSHTMPSPPGIYVLDDGYGLIVKRIELVPGTEPQCILVISDNTSHREREMTVDEARIVGRVVGRVSAM